MAVNERESTRLYREARRAQRSGNNQASAELGQSAAAAAANETGGIKKYADRIAGQGAKVIAEAQAAAIRRGERPNQTQAATGDLLNARMNLFERVKVAPDVASREAFRGQASSLGVKDSGFNQALNNLGNTFGAAATTPAATTPAPASAPTPAPTPAPAPATTKPPIAKPAYGGSDENYGLGSNSGSLIGAPKPIAKPFVVPPSSARIDPVKGYEQALKEYQASFGSSDTDQAFTDKKNKPNRIYQTASSLDQAKIIAGTLKRAAPLAQSDSALLQDLRDKQQVARDTVPNKGKRFKPSAFR